MTPARPSARERLLRRVKSEHVTLALLALEAAAEVVDFSLFGDATKVIRALADEVQNAAK